MLCVQALDVPGAVSKYLVCDSVEEDEPIAQIETDKVTIDLRSPQAGIVESILVSLSSLQKQAPSKKGTRNKTLMQVKEEETISVGQLVATVALGVNLAVIS